MQGFAFVAPLVAGFGVCDKCLREILTTLHDPQAALVLNPTLAGEKADIWRLRSYPKILSLPFISNIKRYDRDNVIDAVIRCDDYIYNEWQRFLHEKPFVMSDTEKRNWIKDFTDVSFSSDAYIPFGDNIERAYKSGVRFIAQSGGSIRDGNVIELCDKYGIAMTFTGIRLFHH